MLDAWPFGRRIACSIFLTCAFFLTCAIDANCARAGVKADECMAKFYVAKPRECTDSVVATLAGGPTPNQPSPAIVGFLTEIFRSTPAEGQRLLTAKPSPLAVKVFIEALHRAGMTDVAQKLAESNGLGAAYAKTTPHWSLLNTIKPSDNPAENDILIGAYMASGNGEYIARLLGNFARADDGMAADAFRLALMQGKFGKSMAPTNREAVIAKNACAKYDCRTDKQKFVRLLTLSSAYWAAESLGRSDDGVKKALATFLDSNVRLKSILATEQVAFGNYLTGLVATAAVKDNPGINEALSIYERLGPASAAVEAMKKM